MKRERDKTLDSECSEKVWNVILSLNSSLKKHENVFKAVAGQGMHMARISVLLGENIDQLKSSGVFLHLSEIAYRHLTSFW